MKNLIVSDVFGRTKALEEIASTFSVSTDIIDPYDSKYMDFNNEADAYAHFIAEVGLEKYAENLTAIIHSFAEDINVIGFSVGASAVWTLSAQHEFPNVTSAYGFYGSQIRYHTKISPTFPIHLIFPASEEHFLIDQLLKDLSGKEKVSMTKTHFLHGFMNRHSNHFNPDGYQQFMQLLCDKPFNKNPKSCP